MRFQDRDGEILKAIYKYGGMLSRRQLKAMFWPEATDRAMNKRLTPLSRADYVSWPTDEQYRTKPIPEPIIWLGTKGILHIAGQEGNEVQEPANNGENQSRQLEQTLRNFGIRWLREPNWNQIPHDLKVTDVWLAVEKAATDSPSFTLEYWIPEREFRSRPDKVEFTLKGKHESRRMIPDGYFVIADEERRAKEQSFRARFLLELDMATEDNPRFESEKIAAGAAYLQSSQYKERFGVNAGRWLIVTTGETRMKHLMERTAHAAGEAAGLFLFSTLRQALAVNMLTSPVWHRVDRSEPQVLLLSRND
jgi:hypothetical protein